MRGEWVRRCPDGGYTRLVYRERGCRRTPLMVVEDALAAAYYGFEGLPENVRSAVCIAAVIAAILVGAYIDGLS